MNDAAITLRNGNHYAISPATDARCRKSILVDGVIAVQARSARAAAELGREAIAWGADTHTSGRTVYIGA